MRLVDALGETLTPAALTGVGPGASIVAFSAICAHRMSYPTRNVSFIDYRHKPMSEDDPENGWWARASSSVRTTSTLPS